jgi:hypothetical protein
LSVRRIHLIPLADAPPLQIRIIDASISAARARLRHPHAAIDQRRDYQKDGRKHIMRGSNVKVIVIALLASAVLFTACGAAGPAYSRATMTVSYMTHR